MAKYYIQLEPVFVVRLGDETEEKNVFQIEKILKYCKDNFVVSDDLKSWHWKTFYGKTVLLFKNLIDTCALPILEFEDDNAALLYLEVM